MSNIDSVDIMNVEKEKLKNKISDDTTDLNELFKTMSLTIVKDKSDYDFGLLRNTKKYCFFFAFIYKKRHIVIKLL